MAALTNTEVFAFMGTPSDIQTTQGSAVTALITQQTAILEAMIGRKISKETITNALLHHGRNCEIYGSTLFLKGKYRDLYTISSISEDGTALSVADDSSDNGYILDPVAGIIERIGSEWSRLPLAIKITGDLGLLKSGDTTSPRDDIKQILIEMVAAKSGLWKNMVTTEDGTIETVIKKISDETQKLLSRYIQRDI